MSKQEKALMDSWPQRELAVVIGAGGMSMAIARRLGQHYDLLLVDIDEARLEAETEKLIAEGMKIEPCVCDITDPDSIEYLASEVKQLGGFRVLAQVAGLGPGSAEAKTIMSVNLVGPALLANALEPYITSGSVAILVSSLSAHLRPIPEEVSSILDLPLEKNFWQTLTQSAGDNGEISSQQSYVFSKAGLIRLCERLALRWGRLGARAVSVSPGLIASPMGISEFKHSPGKYELLSKTPLSRQGNMQEVANVVEFLASERASFINGVDILVDGGVRAAVRHD